MNYIIHGENPIVGEQLQVVRDLGQWVVGTDTANMAEADNFIRMAGVLGATGWEHTSSKVAVSFTSTLNMIGFAEHLGYATIGLKRGLFEKVTVTARRIRNHPYYASLDVAGNTVALLGLWALSDTELQRARLVIDHHAPGASIDVIDCNPTVGAWYVSLVTTEVRARKIIAELAD